MMIVAGIGFIINAITALLFMKGREKDLNIKGAFLHMAADAGVSLGVVIAGFVIVSTGWLWVDPAISLVIVWSLQSERGDCSKIHFIFPWMQYQKVLI